jgi:uncharacterized protein
MSRENVEVVRKAFDLWNSGDLAAVAELYAPDAIVRGLEGLPDAGPFVGREAIRRQFEELREMWDFQELLPHDFIDAGDRVVVRTTWRVQGHGSEWSVEWTFLDTLRRGKIVLVEYFWDHAEALEAVGLRE